MFHRGRDGASFIAVISPGADRLQDVSPTGISHGGRQDGWKKATMSRVVYQLITKPPQIITQAFGDCGEAESDQGFVVAGVGGAWMVLQALFCTHSLSAGVG